MCEQFLVPEDILASVDAHVAETLRLERSPILVDFSEPRYGKAFLRYMLFTRWPNLLGDQAPRSGAHRLYNRYYWFRKFSELFVEVHGRDAGLEQQAFQMLGSAETDVDWGVIEQIDQLVERGG